MKKRRKETATVRGAMEEISKNIPLPERFVVQNDEVESAVIITDTRTNRETQISLYAFGEVRKALNDLFG